MVNAYVLHTVLYRETSLIVKFFTKEYGIVHLVALGAKRPKNNLSAILQPFVPLIINWRQRNKELATLHQAEATNIPHKLTNFNLFGALYINELLLRLLTIMDPHIELFDYYQQFLVNLETIDNKIKLEQLLRTIEKKIIKAIGYEISFNNIKSNIKYCFDLEHGLQPNYIVNNILAPSFSGDSLIALQQNTYNNQQQLKTAKLFMRHVISYFIGNKELHSKKLFL